MTSSSDKPPFSPPTAGMGTALPGTGFPGADLPASQAGGGAPRTEFAIQTGSAEGLLAPPAVSLPKGGGAVRGIGESFSANPVTGTANVSLPLAVSPGRNGFGPSLSLSYDSGAGNGPFGLGWSLSTPSIRRKTERGLPRYLDGFGDPREDSDTFVFSGVEDLVPFLVESGGTWEPDVREEGGYRIARYRPRVEGAFARIERWVRLSDHDIHWRTISADNVTRLYGQSASARVADPAEASRVVEWLLEETHDELGNIVLFTYTQEDGANVPASEPAEARRSSTWTYLARIEYGNATPFVKGGWHFEVVFDYGGHTSSPPTVDPDVDWPVRLDPFSRFRAGFDQRCHRLCHRVLVFHRFTELSTSPVLVRSTELTYSASARITTLSSVTHRGHDGATTLSLPSVDLTYVQPQISEAFESLDGLDDLPFGVDTSSFQWVDLDGEGLTGLLTEVGGALYYKRNEGGSFGPLVALRSQPSMGLAGARLMDLDGDGHLDLVRLGRVPMGYQARDARSESWEGFRSFDSVPDVDWNDPDVRVLDLDGDGHADLLVTEDQVFRWYPSKSREGFGAPRTVFKARDEDEGPTLVFSSDAESLFLADMSGDGLTDLVRIRNGSVCYWPNLGYGRFGPKVQMGGAPWFDAPGAFDPRRLRLADVDGTGPADLLYLGPRVVRLWFNQSGNRFSAAVELQQMPPVSSVDTVSVADLYGDGTACLVWSSPLPDRRPSPLRAVRLMSQGKPWLLEKIENNLGRTTTLSYTPSTAYYVADRRAGRPWATRLPFPVQCLSQVVTSDAVTGWRLASTYAYHHGYFDGPEREFRGFGMVEQWDAEQVGVYEGASNGETEHYVPPVRTRTWFHTGAWRDEERLEEAYASEYFSGDSSAGAPEGHALPRGLSAAQRREAARALKGRALRTEVYADDGSEDADAPYVVTSSRYEVKRLQPGGDGTHGVFLVVPRETLTQAYDRQVSDPRVSHTLSLEVDAYGVVTKGAAVSYPRRGSPPYPEQAELTVVVTQQEVVHDVSSPARLHVGVPSRTRSWQLTGLTATDAAPFTVEDLSTAFEGAVGTVAEIEHEATPGSGVVLRRLTEERVLYWKSDLSGPEVLGAMGARRLVYEGYTRAYTSGQLSGSYDPTEVTSTVLEDEGGYVDLDSDGVYWRPSGRSTRSASHFYQPTSYTDPFGNTTAVSWDAHDLFVDEVEDAVGNTVTVSLDYRVLAPWRVTDPHGHVQEVAYDALGRVVKTAVRSEDGTEGDTLTSPTTEVTYELDRWVDDGLPARVHTRTRETHADSGTRWLERYDYRNGSGQVIASKANAEPGPAPKRDASGALVYDAGGELVWETTSDRWLGTGRTVLNNKGQPVKQYEPYFDSTEAFTDESDLVAWGVTPVLHYDPVGRNTRVDQPDGTYREVVHGAWRVESWDENDTVTDSDWYAERIALGSGDDYDAALKAADHAETPVVTHLDALGRVFLTQEDDGATVADTRLTLDVQGRVLVVTDALGHATQVWTYDLLGRVLTSCSPDVGDDEVLVDVGGQPLRTWRSGDLSIRRAYDALRRPTHLWVKNGSSASWRLHEYTVYGDFLTGSEVTSIVVPGNLRGRVYRQYDGAGRVEATSYDFKGNLQSSTRVFLVDVDTPVDWSDVADDTTSAAMDLTTSSDLDTANLSFTTTSTHDALNRPVTGTTPDGSVTTLSYNEGGLLESLEADVVYAPSATTLVTDIDYDEHGRRKRVEYGNGTSTTYTYDARSHRLVRLVTVRASDSKKLQDLRYVYDAVGNLVKIADAADDTVFFNNQAVSPTAVYGYDARYRLTRAQGRQNTTAAYTWQLNGDPTTPPAPTPSTYDQRYVYDAVGNLTVMRNVGGWVRTYAYATGSNRLTSTTVGSTTTSPTYNARGAMASMAHLQSIARDFRDQPRRIDVNATKNEVYHYDSGGQRVRKVTRTSVTRERFYLGPFEVYREDADKDRRETLHFTDGTRRMCMVETRTHDGNGSALTSPSPVVRYQLDNHLGSSVTETDDSGLIISHEEYAPYGSTTWFLSNGSTEVSQKRYRYTGKERDEATGLYYHGARYYAPWLGRWASADPIGLGDGTNRYGYVGGRPVGRIDSCGTRTNDPPLIASRGNGVVATSEQEIREQSEGRGIAFRGMGRFATGVVAGDTLRNPDAVQATGQVVGSVVIGLTPLGVATDIRDIAGNLAHGRPGMAAISAVGLVPGVGDVASAGTKHVALPLIATVGGVLVKNADEAAQAAKGARVVAKAAEETAEEVIEETAEEVIEETAEGVASKGGATLFHGTDVDSALHFLNRGGLDAGAAAAGKIDGPAGFFMATVKDDAIFFGARRQGTVLEVNLSGKAVDALTGKGMFTQPIPAGKSSRFVGDEFVVPTEAFDTFNDLLQAGEITFKPGL